MASIASNVITSEFRGAIGKLIVFRIRNGKTFASKYPDMSRVKPSRKQLAAKAKFAKAVAYAQRVINDPKKRGVVKVRNGQSMFNAAISEYMKRR